MNDRKFDELLDGILQEDAYAEPIAGLEDRILTRMASPPERRFSWRFMMWGVGAAIPVCLALAFALNHHPAPRLDPPMMAHHQTAPAPPTPIEPAAPRTKSTLAPHNAKPLPVADAAAPTTEQAEALPKLDVFPTPTEAEEPVRALAALAAVRQAPPLPAGQPDKLPAKIVVEPITIAAIEVKPLFPIVQEPKKKSQDPKETR